jgi:hypothetical protein
MICLRFARHSPIAKSRRHPPPTTTNTAMMSRLDIVVLFPCATPRK